MVELIDLAGYVESGQPVYPGNQRTQVFTSMTHEESGYTWARGLEEETETVGRKLRAERAGEAGEHPLVRTLLVSEHGPTHVDALTHVDPTSDGSVDRLPLDRFYGDAVGIDVSGVPPEAHIEVADLESALDAGGVEVREGDAITLHTGHHAANYAVDDHESRYAYLHEYTGLTGEAAHWLADRGVRNIGIDAPSIDHSDAIETKAYPAHDMCAERGVLNMENMANLDAVAGRRYTLCAFPLKIRDGTGSPIRPVAILG